MTITVTKSAWTQSFFFASRLQTMGLRAKSDKLTHGSAEKLVLCSGFFVLLENRNLQHLFYLPIPLNWCLKVISRFPFCMIDIACCSTRTALLLCHRGFRQLPVKAVMGVLL